MRKGQGCRAVSVVLINTFLFYPLLTWAQVVGKVGDIEGTAEASRTGAPSWIALAVPNDVVFRDQLRTQALSKLKVRFRDESNLTLGENSQITVDEQIIPITTAPTSVFNMVGGKVRAVVTDRYKLPGSRFEIRTPVATAGVRGTEFIFDFSQPDAVFIHPLDDCVFVTSPSCTGPGTTVCAGSSVRVLRNACPDQPTPSDPAVIQALLQQTTIKGGIAGWTLNQALAAAFGTAAVFGATFGIGTATGGFDDDRSKASPSE